MDRIDADLNPLANGLVRGRREDTGDTHDLHVDDMVLVADGEGNEALGTIRELRDGLAFVAVDWDTLGREGSIQVLTLPALTKGRLPLWQVPSYGSVWHQAGASSYIEAKSVVAERLAKAA